MPDPTPEPDPFALLGLPRRFDLPMPDIQRAWLTRTARLHPDRPDAPPDAAERLARLNHAHADLADPERRAAALLALLGGPSKEQDKSLPPGFLEEMLDVRERMESDLDADPASRERWDCWAAERRDTSIARVARLFNAPPTPGSLREIRTELNAWRYIERMIEQLDPR
jgi:molecular chaperone HscB